MIKRLLPLFIILSVPVFVCAGYVTHTFHFSEDDVSFSEYNGYDVIHLKGGVSSTEVGEPSIPYVVANFVIPPSSEVVGVEVISKHTEEIVGEYTICPVQEPRPISLDIDIPFVEPVASIYNSGELYPGEDIVMFPSGSMSGYRIAGIFVNPLQYIPNEGRLILSTELSVRLEYEEGVNKVLSLTEEQRRVFGRSVSIIVENGEDIGRFSPFVRDVSRACEYAIITGSSYESEWQRLADWKSAAGYSAQVFTTDWIYSNYSGYDNPESIRNFLKDYFTNQGLIYAVLGGDVAIVPERDVYAYYSPGHIAADYYYSDLDGDWDGNGNHQYGEISDGVDGYFDIYVGRPPIDNAADINSFLQKDSVYIYAPEPAHIQKLLLPSVWLWSQYNYHGSFVNNAIGDMFPGWTVTKLEDEAAYSPNTRNKINENYNLMHIAAHGNQNGFYSESSNPVLTTSDIPYLDNTMPLIINSIACYPGDFDEYSNCFAEQIVNESGGGCVACVLNARYGWGTPPTMGPSERLDTTFYAVMNNDTFPIGIVHGATKNHFRNSIWTDQLWHYCGLELNLFGEPEMVVQLAASSDPYIYISSRDFQDENGDGTWEPGEDGELVVTLSNCGGMAATNVQGVLRATTNGQYVDIIDSTYSFGDIAVCGSSSNTEDPFLITADAGTPPGTIIEFTLHITADGGYDWDEIFEYVIVNPYYEHNIGNVRFTVTNSGICGFMDETQTLGSGFHYPKTGAQHLYIGSVWVGNNPGYVVNKDYSAENSGDWVSLEGVIGDGTVYSDQDSWARYDDAGMGSPKGLTCIQDGWAWSDVGGEDYVIMRYRFTNEGEYAINGLFFGQFMDWNVGDGSNNTGGVDTTRNLIYQYESGSKFVGVGLLDPPVARNVTFIYNPDYVDPQGYILDSDKIWFLQGILSSHYPTPDSDWSVCVSSGPVIIGTEDTTVFAVAILGGEGLSDIQANYDSALARYGLLAISERPGVSSRPSSITISKTYPQPFSTSVNIEYTVPENGKISLSIYDVCGRLVNIVVNGEKLAGVYTAKWNGRDGRGEIASTGVYFCRLQVKGTQKTITRKLILVK